MRLLEVASLKASIPQLTANACYNSAFTMAQIYPFQAWRYAPDRVPIAQVVTQPYYKITP